MLRCYLLTVCQASSLDRDSNAISLFNMIEGISVPVEGLGVEIPVQVHVYFSVEADEFQHSAFEMRVIRVGADGEEDPGGSLPFRTEEAGRMRVRAQALRLPRAYGNFNLRVEWRRADTEEWHAEPNRWPFDLTPLSEVPAVQGR